MKQIRILIVDDHTVVRQGIRMMVSTEPTLQIIGEANNGREAVDQARSLRPDVVLLDLVMPDEDGIEALLEIKQSYPAMKVIVLTTFADEDRINTAMTAGADGYLLKDADGEALLRALHSVQNGELPLHPRVARHLIEGVIHRNKPSRADELTEREKEILELLATGLSNKEMAQTLHLAEGTVKVYVSKILRKFNVSNRTEAAMHAKQNSLTRRAG